MATDGQSEREREGIGIIAYFIDKYCTGGGENDWKAAEGAYENLVRDGFIASDPTPSSEARCPTCKSREKDKRGRVPFMAEPTRICTDPWHGETR